MKQLMRIGELAWFAKKRHKCIAFETPKGATTEEREARCKMCSMRQYDMCFLLRCSRGVRPDRTDVFFVEYKPMKKNAPRKEDPFYRRNAVRQWHFPKRKRKVVLYG